jgi:hypothetical protein
MSALSTEVALESDVNDSLTTLFPAFPYISGAFVVGPGTLKYSAIDSIELATKTTKGGTAVVLEGELKFTLDVLLPAQDPTPKPDTNTSYIATVTLSPTHSKFTSA